MNEQQRALIRAFVENKQMFEAVRDVLLSGMIGEDFTQRNWVFGISRGQSDASYGKEVKIKVAAIEWINSGFNELTRIASSNPQREPKNEAR